MSDRRDIRQFLKQHGATPLDVSRRGSGLNGVWAIQYGQHPAILKVYDRRRGPLQTRLSNFANRLRGLTPYSAAARCRVEQQMFCSWRAAGFDVPSLLDPLPDRPIPPQCVLMERIDGELLGDLLLDNETESSLKDRLFVRFLRQWGQRHATAEKTANLSLIQERPMFGHVFVAQDRFVTFDLETRFVRARSVRSLIVREICGYLRSLLKHLPDAQIAHFLALLVARYPHRRYLEAVYPELFRNPSLPARCVHTIDRRFIRRHKKMRKYEIAQRLQALLTTHH